MDNFTHSMAGWALGQAGLKTKTRKGLAALILGANAPDIDVFFGWVSWAPLSTHRGVTHSLVAGVIVLPVMLAGLLWLLDKWQVSRGKTFKSGLSMHFGWLLALSWLGTLTHPLLDLQTSYAVQLLSPFTVDWYHSESLFIIDVWIWLGMSFALWLSRRREELGQNWQKPARIGLIAALAYIGMNTGLTHLSERKLLATAPFPKPDALFFGHAPVKFWTRQLIYRENGKVSRAQWSPFAPFEPATEAVADRMSDPVARRAMVANRENLDFMRWSVIPMADIVKSGCTGKVTFNDARFGDPRIKGRFVREVEVPLTPAECRR